MPLSERIRRVGKIALIGWFGFLVFSVVFYLSLPYDRFKGVLASRLSAYGYEMEAKHVGPSLGLGMTLDEVTLISQATGAAKPTRILVERATLGWSLLSYLLGSQSYSLSADVFSGELDVKVKTDKSDTSVRASATEINLFELPWLKRATNLPASGTLEVALDLDLPKRRPSEAKGHLALSCASCVLGDGKAKLVIASHPLLAEGLGLPKIRLGDFKGKVVIEKGVGSLHGIYFKSQDLEATVEGEIHLAQPIATSRIDLYVRFKLSDSLLRSSEKLRTIMDLTAMMGKRPDGFLGFRVTGTLRSMGRVQWLKISPFKAVPGMPRPAPPPAPPASPKPPPPSPAPAPPPPSPPPVPTPPVAPPPAPTPPPAPPPPPPPVPAAAPPPPAAPGTAPSTAAAAATTNVKPGEPPAGAAAPATPTAAPPATATAPPPPPPASEPPGVPTPPNPAPSALVPATPGTTPSIAAAPTTGPKPGVPAGTPAPTTAAAAAPPPVIILPAPYTGTAAPAARPAPRPRRARRARHVRHRRRVRSRHALKLDRFCPGFRPGRGQTTSS